MPAGCTSICQPADVSWNAYFKRKVRDEWKMWRRDERTAAGNLKMAPRQDVINWVSAAWDAVSADVTGNSFKHCGITLALDGSEDELFNDRLADALAATEQKDNNAGEENSDNNSNEDTEPYFHECESDSD